MRLALLQCDHVSDKFRDVTGGDYDEMFDDVFARHATGVSVEAFDVTRGIYPASLNDFDGYLTTGSKFSVYDDEPWVNGLNEYVRELYWAGKKFVGICFGHQMMAQALGGKVAKSPNGWGIGVHSSEIATHEAWMQPPLKHYGILMSCQDQVQLLPPDSTVLAGNDFCPVAMYRVGKHFLGIQGHPEFNSAYSEALMLARRHRIPANTIERATETLSHPIHQKELMQWIVNFIQHG